MTKMMRRAWLVALSLVAFLVLPLIAQISPTASAASFAPYSGGCNPPWWQISYGVSYDADTASPSLDSREGYAFSFSQQWAPDVALYGYACFDANGNMNYQGYLFFGLGDAATTSFNLEYTVDNQTTMTNYPANASFISRPLFGNHREMELSLAPHRRYTFRVGSCYGSVCSSWSPLITIVTYQNLSCQNGYVFRVANPYDQVCVTPAERDQAATDNYYAPSRINPTGPYGPKTCINGYVWREAFGGDYTCVTPTERSQAASDNYYAPYRVVAW